VSSLIVAFRFLTIVPVPGREAAGPEALGKAAWWFPVVGLLLGIALAAADRLLLLLFPPVLAAVLAVAAWKVASGGLHLDGLADSLDGLGGADPDRRLEIMRDGRIGVFGAAGVVLCLLAAIAALTDLPAAVRGVALAAAPAVGRIAPVLGGTCFPAAAAGLGAEFATGLSRWTGPVQLLGAALLAPLALGPSGGLVVVAAAGLALAWCALMAWRLGGVTGDSLGGAVEVAELAVLLAVALLTHRRWA
jgi:adenosylcobinamide-GDP ribazoletransferase